MSRRWLVGGIGAIAVLALACGSGREGGAAGPEPIQVGHYASLTGDTATFGQSTDRGLRMKIDEINAAGGVLGRPIEIITEDDRSITEEARSAAQKLLQRDQVVALLGEVASSRSLAAAPEAQRARIPMITPASTNPKVTEVGDYIFRACFIDPFQGAVMAKFARETLGADRVAILFDFKQDYSVGLADFFRKTFEASGGTIVADERYTSGDIEFRAQLTKIRATKPDAIFVPGYYTEVGLIARQAKAVGLKVPLLGGDGWDSSKLTEIGGDAIEGSYFSNHYSVENQEPHVQRFIAAYEAAFKAKPDGLAALGYDAMMILADAIKRAGSDDPRKVRDALAATKGFKGVTGMITIDENRNAKKSAVVLKIMSAGFKYQETIAAD